MFPRDEQSSNWRIRRKGRLVFLEWKMMLAAFVCRYPSGTGTVLGTVRYGTVQSVQYGTVHPTHLLYLYPGMYSMYLPLPAVVGVSPGYWLMGPRCVYGNAGVPATRAFHPLQLTLSTSVQALGWKMHTASRHSGNPTAGPTHPSRPLYVINRTAVPPVLLRK